MKQNLEICVAAGTIGRARVGVGMEGLEWEDGEEAGQGDNSLSNVSWNGVAASAAVKIDNTK